MAMSFTDHTIKSQYKVLQTSFVLAPGSNKHVLSLDNVCHQEALESNFYHLSLPEMFYFYMSRDI